MIWLNNIEKIATSGVAGNCPYCKSENTNYSVKKICGDVGYGDIWCNECKKAYHISRIKITPAIERDIEVPDGLIY